MVSPTTKLKPMAKGRLLDLQVCPSSATTSTTAYEGIGNYNEAGFGDGRRSRSGRDGKRASTRPASIIFGTTPSPALLRNAEEVGVPQRRRPSPLDATASACSSRRVN
jgi:hypothetical protein